MDNLDQGGKFNMAYKMVLYEVKNNIAYITLNRPEKLNAINREVALELRNALRRAKEDHEVRVIILKGAGRAFSAGDDYTPDRAGKSYYESGKTADNLLRALCHALLTHPKPIIAQVHGYAIAGAQMLVSCCDIIIAAEGTKFGIPTVRYGSGSPAIFPYLIGWKKTAEMLLTGRMFDAVEAERIGLINKVVPAHRLEEQVQLMAEMIKILPPTFTKQVKSALLRAYEMQGLSNFLNYSTLMQQLRYGSKEFEEFHKSVEEKSIKEALRERDGKARELEKKYAEI